MSVVPETVAAIRQGIAQAGVDLRRLPSEPIEDDEGLAELWRQACARAGRSSFPLEVGLAMPLGSMGALDYLAASSSTIGSAVTVAQELFSLAAPGVQLLIDRLRSSWRVRLQNQPPFPGEAASDLFIVGVLLARLREFASTPPELSLVELAMPSLLPRDREAIRALVDAPLAFDRRLTALHLTATTWAQPLRTADARLLKTLRATLSPGPRWNDDALLVAVRALIAKALPRLRSIDETAPDLGHSVRTLQRRLGARGTTWAEVLDDVRRDRAETLVDARGLSLGEVAYAVGFAEQASFTRAWRRWFGATPSDSLRRTARRRTRSQSRQR